MHLIFIRHGDPNYAQDALTPRGRQDAALLAQRVRGWAPTACFVSPLGRAQETCTIALEGTGWQAETLDWLEEFRLRVPRPERGGELGCCWDLLPEQQAQWPVLADRDHWWEHPFFSTGPREPKAEVQRVQDGIDALLARYGYQREQSFYRHQPGQPDPTLVCFCHLGVIGVLAGHLLGIAPPLLWHGFFLPTTSVTVLNTEERTPGVAAFRCQMMGDTAHLSAAGAPVAPAGSFGPLFMG